MLTVLKSRRYLFASLLLALLAAPLCAQERLTQVGAAKVDITPSYPIRLTGTATE